MSPARTTGSHYLLHHQSTASLQKSLLLPPLQVFRASSGYRFCTRDYLYLPNGWIIEHRSHRTSIKPNPTVRTQPPSTQIHNHSTESTYPPQRNDLIWRPSESLASAIARAQSQSEMLEHGARAEASLDILMVRDKDTG